MTGRLSVACFARREGGEILSFDVYVGSVIVFTARRSRRNPSITPHMC